MVIFGIQAAVTFMSLLYVNLIVTDNALSNLNQLTGNRLKLITLFRFSVLRCRLDQF